MLEIDSREFLNIIKDYRYICVFKDIIYFFNKPKTVKNKKDSSQKGRNFSINYKIREYKGSRENTRGCLYITDEMLEALEKDRFLPKFKIEDYYDKELGNFVLKINNLMFELMVISRRI